MKITICGSIAFYDEMLAVKKELEAMGHEVEYPHFDIRDQAGQPISVKQYYDLRITETDNSSWLWERKAEAIQAHFEKVEWSDAIIVLNYTKRDVANYIGANTLIEMGLAFWLRKKIFQLNPIPEVSYKEEILGLKPIVINGDLMKIL